MKFEAKLLDKFTLEMQFTATKEEFNKAEDKIYEEEKSKYEVQGFRSGKAPKKMIKQNYGEGVFFNETFVELAMNVSDKYFEENPEIRTYGDPKLDVVSFEDGVLTGKLTFKVMPEVKLGAYKGLSVSAILNEFTPEMVEEELKHAQLHHTHSHIAEGKIAENGDIAVIDFVGSIDGVEFEGGKAEGYELELGSHSFIDTFEDQLVGHKAGEHVTVKVKFPENYGAKSLAGKEAVFEVDIKSINTKHIPEINDELAKHVANVDTVEEWKKQVESQIRFELDRKNMGAKEDAILAKVVDNSEIELPKEVIDEQLDTVMKDLSQRLMYQGLRLEDYATYVGTTMEALREERRADAERIAKTKQVLEAIVRAEKIVVTEEEVEAKIEETAKFANMTTKEYKKGLDNRHINYIYSDILMGKLMKVLLDNNEVVPSKDEEVEKTSAKKTTKTVEKKTEAKKTTKTATKKSTTKKTA